MHAGSRSRANEVAMLVSTSREQTSSVGLPRLTCSGRVVHCTDLHYYWGYLRRVTRVSVYAMDSSRRAWLVLRSAQAGIPPLSSRSVLFFLTVKSWVHARPPSVQSYYRYHARVCLQGLYGTTEAMEVGTSCKRTDLVITWMHVADWASHLYKRISRGCGPEVAPPCTPPA
jgi:hypothetical protein